MTDLLDPGVEQTELPNGLRIVTETMPEARSVTLGAWVRVGGRDEAPELSGASHFLEHLLFKGTEQRSARQIAEAVDSVGGEMNAFTAREHTAYYARLPHARVDVGLDILGDVLAGPGAAPGRGGGRAAGHRRGDPDEPRRARGPRAHRAVASGLRRPPARSRGARRDGHGRGDHPRRHRRLLRPLVPTRHDGGHGGRPPRPPAHRRRGGRRASAHGIRRRAARAHAAPAADRHGRSSSATTPSRRTSASAGAACPTATTTAGRCRSPTRCSAAAWRAACSRRCARSEASPTPCTPTRPPSRTPGTSRSTAAPRPSGPARRWA